MRILKKIGILLILIIMVIWVYTNSLIGVEELPKKYLEELNFELKKSNYQSQYFVISGKRWKLDNYILNKLGGAASKSQHLKGQAIDLIILDINKDGKRNSKDVDIVYKILDEKIIKNKGGLGSYKNEKGFLNKQMIHFDSRGKRVRWNR